MKKEIMGFILIICISFLLLSCSKEEPAPTATPEPTVTVTPTPTPSPTPTPTKEPDPEFEKQMAEIDFLYNIVNEYTDMSEEEKEAEYQKLKNNKTFRFGLSYGYELGYSDGCVDGRDEVFQEAEKVKIYEDEYEYNDGDDGREYDDTGKYHY